MKCVYINIWGLCKTFVYSGCATCRPSFKEVDMRDWTVERK